MQSVDHSFAIFITSPDLFLILSCKECYYSFFYRYGQTKSQVRKKLQVLTIASYSQIRVPTNR